MRVLVTGVAGFIGSNLADRLLREGVEVRGVDAMTDYYDTDIKRRNLRRLDGLEYVEGDLNSIALEELLDGVDVVFHQAGQPGVRKSWGTEFTTYSRQNIDATQRLLETARQAPALRRFVYASSSSVYGDAERYPTVETDRPRPISPYGVTKLAAEHLVTLYGTRLGVPTTSLRYFTVYGPGQRPDMAFSKFFDAAVRGDAITIYGDGTQIRDFTYVGDVVDANLRLIESDVPYGSVFNVSGGSSISVNDVLDRIRELVGSVRVDHVERALGDAARTGGDSSALREATGWEPTTHIVAGLARQWAAVHDN